MLDESEMLLIGEIARHVAESHDAESLESLLVESGDADEKMALIVALEVKGDPASALALLRHGWREKDPNVQYVLLQVLGRLARERPCLSPAVSERLLLELRGDNFMLRRAAILGLTTLLKNERNHDFKAILGLALATHADGEVFNRYAAAEGLSGWGALHLPEANSSLRNVVDRIVIPAIEHLLKACVEKGDLPETQRACSRALEALNES